MEYGRLIREAWALTWRYRFLWVLGFFAGGAVGASIGNGSSTRWETNPTEINTGLPGATMAAQDASRWLAGNVGVVIVVAILFVLLGLALLAISLIAQGGMAQATADLARGLPTSLGQAWHTGRRLVWRYAGLWLLLIAAAVLVASLVGVVVSATVGLGLFAGAGTPLLTAIVLAVIIGLPLALAGLVAAVAVSIIIAYAQRAIAIEDLGPWSALQAGWRVLCARPGPSLLAWLINLGLAVATTIAIGLMAAVAAAPVAGLAALIWLSAGYGTLVVGLLVVAGLAAMTALVVMAAMANTFFWHYWTLTYLRLGGQGQQVAIDPIGGPGAAPLRPGTVRT